MKRILPLLALLAGQAFAGSYIGEYAPGDTVDCNFSTYRPSTGATFTLGGTPAVSAYKDNSATQSTAGITLSADFDSVTGLNHVRVTTGTDGTFYSAGSFFSLVITTGTVDSVSVTGSEVCSFSLNKEAGLRPTTAARTLDVTSTGEAGVDWANVGSPTTTVNLSGTTISTSQAVASVAGAVGSVASGGINEASFATTAGSMKPLGIIDQGTAQSASGTTLVLRSALAMANDTAIGMTLVACGSTQGYCQARAVTDYVSSTDTATVDTWTVTPSGTITYYLFGTAPSSGSGSGLDAAGVRAAVGLASANLDTQLSDIQSDADNLQTRLPTSLLSGRIDASVGAYQSGLTPLQPTTAGRTLDVTATGEAGIDWANIGGATTTVNLSGTSISTSQAVASVSGAVASVTGNVGGTINGLTSTAQGNVRTAVGLASANLDTQLDALPTAAENADATWDEVQSGHTTAGTFGRFLDSQLATIGSNVNSILDDTGTSGVVVATGSKTGYTLSAAGVDAIWDEAQSGHSTAGTFGLYLDSAISGVSTGGVSAAAIADAVWDETQSGHTTAGTFGLYVDSAISGVSTGGISASDIADEVQTRTIAGVTTVGTVNALAANSVNASALASDATAELQSGLATSSGLTSESSTIQAAIAALNDLSADDIWTYKVEDQNGGIEARCLLAALHAIVGGDFTSSGSTTTFKDVSGTETRAAATYGSSTRTMTITCPTY